MHKLFFSEDALLDIQESFIWYEQQKEGLGNEFLESVYKSTEKICSNPLVYQVQYKELRIKITPRFPWRIFFMIDENKIVIQSVRRMSRKTKADKEE